MLPIYSTNHKTDGMYWPAEDCRHFFAWSDRTRADMQTDYWRNYWNDWGYGIQRDDVNKDEFWKGYWKHLREGADYHVVAYLMQPELIADFNPGATPPHTEAWHAVVAANSNPEDDKLADLLDQMGDMVDFLGVDRPNAVTIGMITSHRDCPSDVAEFFTTAKNNRAWPHRLEVAGYAAVRNAAAKDGRWRVAGSRQTIYVKREFGAAEAQRAAQDLIESVERKTTTAPSATAEQEVG